MYIFQQQGECLKVRIGNYGKIKDNWIRLDLLTLDNLCQEQRICQISGKQKCHHPDLYPMVGFSHRK